MGGWAALRHLTRISLPIACEVSLCGTSSPMCIIADFPSVFHQSVTNRCWHGTYVEPRSGRHPHY